MYKVKALNKISKAGVDILKERGYEFLDADTSDSPDAVLVRSADMHNYVYDEKLLCVARAGVGTNNIPKDRFAQDGIAVFNTPGANAVAVKELAICALLLSSRDICGGVSWVKSISDMENEIPQLVEKQKSKFAGPEIMGKTLGVIGLGAIGAKIAGAAIKLGMKVYGYDPYLSVDAAWQLPYDVINASSLDTIYKNCDYITLHVPYIQDTHHMINQNSIKSMKPGVRIINLARGELVCDEDIVKALDDGKVARYVTDFPNSITANHPNIIAMPHLGASTPESEENCTHMAVQAIIEYVENGNLLNCVNLPSVYVERTGSSRACIIHQNLQGILQHILNIIGRDNVNILNVTSKPRGDFAYTIIDMDKSPGEGITHEISHIESVLRVRVI